MKKATNNIAQITLCNSKLAGFCARPYWLFQYLNMDIVLGRIT